MGGHQRRYPRTWALDGTPMGASAICGAGWRWPGRGGLELRRWRRWTSGGERHAAQPVQRQEELARPRPAGGQVQVALAGRAGQPPGQVQVAGPQRLGGNEGLAQPDPGDPAGEVVGDDVQGHPGGVGGELPGWQVVEADAVLEVTDGVFDLGVAAVVVVAKQCEWEPGVGRTRRTIRRMTRPLRPNGR